MSSIKIGANNQSQDSTYFIAIYGGSFDPPHLAHLEILKILTNNPFCLQTILLPNYQNPLKSKSLFSPNERLKMCEILAQISGDKTAISDYEIRQNRPTHTIASIRTLQKQISSFLDSNQLDSNPPDSNSQTKLCFVLGSDSFETLHLWKDSQSLCELVEFIVVKRETSTITHPQNLTPKVRTSINLSHFNAISSSKVRELLHNGEINKALKMLPQEIFPFIHAHFKL